MKAVGKGPLKAMPKIPQRRQRRIFTTRASKKTRALKTKTVSLASTWPYRPATGITLIAPANRTQPLTLYVHTFLSGDNLVKEALEKAKCTG